MTRVVWGGRRRRERRGEKGRGRREERGVRVGKTESRAANGVAISPSSFGQKKKKKRKRKTNFHLFHPPSPYPRQPITAIRPEECL